jgi:hypothetical protein
VPSVATNSPTIVARPTLRGDERAWWKAAGIDPNTRMLWKHTRVSEGRVPPNGGDASDCGRSQSARDPL